MTEDSSSIRLESRITTSRPECLSQNEIHYLAMNFIKLPKDELRNLILRLKKNYQSSILCEEEDEYLITSNLISIFSHEIPEDDFQLFSYVLCIIFHANFKNTKKNRKLYRTYLNYSLPFLQSNNLIYISSSLSVISNITSRCENLAKSAFRIIPIQLLFQFINLSINITDIYDIKYSIMLKSAHILNNIFSTIKIDLKSVDIIENLFNIVEMLCQSQQISKIPEMLYCIRHVIARRSEYCSKIIQHNFIKYFNELLKSDNENIQLYVILIFYQLILNNIGFDDIYLLEIYQMIASNNPNISHAAIKLFASYLQKVPASSDGFFHLNILQTISLILKDGQLCMKIQALNIIFSLLCNASSANKFALIQIPNLIDSLVEMISIFNDPQINLIFKIFQLIISVANQYNFYEQIKEKFMTSFNVQAIECLANQDRPTAEIAILFLNGLYDSALKV